MRTFTGRRMGSEHEPRQPLLEDCRHAEESSRTRKIRNESTTATSLKRLPRFSLVDYRPLNGIPHRVLEPSNGGTVFTCRAFSADGTCLATGDDSGCIRLWRTADYTLVAGRSDAFENAVDCLSFEQKKNDRLIAIDTEGNYKSMNLTWFDDERKLNAASATEGVCCSLASVRRGRFHQFFPPKNLSDICKYQFSSNGRIVLRVQFENTYHDPKYEIHTIDVFKLNLRESIASNIELDDDRKYRKGFPLLSKNGESVLVCSVSETTVWPRLDFDAGSGQQHSITLDGTCAVWGLQGEYLLLWKTTENKESTKQSTIFVYRTEDLCLCQKSDQLIPLRSKTFPPGKFRYEAQVLERLSESDESIEVLIAETDVNGNRRRVLIWDITKDVVRNQILIPTERGPRLIKTHTTFRGRHGDKGANDPKSDPDDASYILRIIEAVYPKFCISKNRRWIGAFSQRFQSCSIVSVESGATVWSSGVLYPLHSTEQQDIPTEAMYDPNGDHFLIMGECAIIVFAPEFLDDKLNTEECDKTFLKACACLPSQSLASALEEREHDSDFPAWITDVTSSISRNSYISDATQSAHGKRLAFIDSNRETSSQPIGSAKIVCFEKGEGRAFPDLAFEDAGTQAASESFIPNRLFLYDNGNGPDQGLVAFSLIDKPTAMFIDLMTRKKREKKLKNIDKCLRISQTADRKRVTILDIGKVVILDLRSETTFETIKYKVDFTNLLGLVTAKTKWKRKRRDGIVEDTQKRVSDDGRCVLLSWDQGMQESIVVHPSSGQQEVEDLLKQPNRVLSDYCTLSSDGRATCFIDMCAIRNYRITVGIFNESDRQVFHRVHIPFGSSPLSEGSFFDMPERIDSTESVFDNTRNSISCTSFSSFPLRHHFSDPLEHQKTVAVYHREANRSQEPETLVEDMSTVFCGISDNGSEIFLDGGHFRFSSEQERRRFLCLRFRDTEDSATRYKKLDGKNRKDIGSFFQRLATKNGPSFVNTPYGSGQSFFREAFKNKDGEVVKCCIAHAEKTGVLLDVGNVPRFDDEKEEAVELPDFNDIVENLKGFWDRWWSVRRPKKDQSREVSSNILKEALDEKSMERVKEAVELICSPITPFRSAAWLMKTYYKQLWKEYPEIIMNALFQKSMFFETCQPRVYDNFLSLASWKDKTRNQGTSDAVSNWQFIDSPDRLDKRNGLEDQTMVDREEHEETKVTTLRSMKFFIQGGENGEDMATVQASLKFLRIEDAARIGMNGIIRPLLMRNAPTDIFRSKAVKAVTQYKWLIYWGEGFYWYVGPYILFMAVFTTYSIYVAESSAVCEGDLSDDNMRHCCLAVLVLFGIYMMYEELYQICTFVEDGRVHFGSRMRGAAYFFRSKWNWLDLLSCIFLLSIIPALHISACLTSDPGTAPFDGSQEGLSSALNQALSATLALEAVLVSTKVWYFAQPFQNFGALVLMVRNVIVDCFAFLVLSSAVIFGFGLALHILHRHAPAEEVMGIDDDSEEGGFFNGKGEKGGDFNGRSEKSGDFTGDYGSLPKSLLTLFYALFGAFEAEFPYVNRFFTLLFTLFFGLYMVIAVILLLNLLIAIMGDTFDRTKSSEESQMLIARASFIDAWEATLTKKERKKIEKETGKYLYILEHADGEARKVSSSWTGKLRMLEERFESCIKKSEKNLKKENEKLKDDTRKQNEKLYRLMQRMAEKIETESKTTKGQTPTVEGGDKRDDADISAMERDGGKQEYTACLKEDSSGSGNASDEGPSNP